MAIEQLIKGVMDATPSVRRRVEDVLKGIATVERGNGKKDTRLVTISGAARLLDIGRGTCYKLIKSGRLDVVELNGSHRVTMQSINEFLAGERPANEKTEKLISASRARYAATKEKEA